MSIDSKTCFRCGVRQPIADFYKHPQMADGHLNKCKSCTKADTARREAKLMSDPVLRERELERHRRKSERHRAAGLARKQSTEERRDVLRRHRINHPVATRARRAVAYAIRTKKLVRLPCEVCGNPRSQAHHPDHTKPLDVQWLCARHHADADIELRSKQFIDNHPIQKTHP